jgi:hypothetical protein
VYMWHSTYDCRTSSAGIPSYRNERTETLEQAVALQDKLYGDAENLELTTNFFKRINVNVKAANAKEKKETNIGVFQTL